MIKSLEKGGLGWAMPDPALFTGKYKNDQKLGKGRPGLGNAEPGSIPCSIH